MFSETFPTQMPKAKPPCRGFTLIEMIVTITVLAIVGLGLGYLIRQTTQSYVDVARREELAAIGRIAIEKVTREIRNALPDSVRIANNGSNACIEFFPILMGGRYQDQNGSYATTGDTKTPAPISGLTTDSECFDTLGAAVNDLDASGSPYAGQSKYLAIYPRDAAASDPTSPYYNPSSASSALAAYLYGDGGNNAPCSADTAAGDLLQVRSVRFANTHSFPRHSPNRRFYVVGEPVSFCLHNSGELRRYSGYGVNQSQATNLVGSASSNLLIAQDLQLRDDKATATTADDETVTPFRYQSGGLARNALVSLDFRLKRQVEGGAPHDSEWVRLQHEIQIRNAP